MKISEVRFMQAVDFGVPNGPMNATVAPKAAMVEQPNGVLITIGPAIRLVPWANIRHVAYTAEAKPK